MSTRTGSDNPFPTPDFLEQYLRAKANGQLKSSYIKVVTLPSGGIKMLFDIPATDDDEKALAQAQTTFDSEFFDNGDVISPVSVDIYLSGQYMNKDERLFCIELDGPASEICANIKRNDPEGFAQVAGALQHITKSTEGRRP